MLSARLILQEKEKEDQTPLPARERTISSFPTCGKSLRRSSAAGWRARCPQCWRSSDRILDSRDLPDSSRRRQLRPWPHPLSLSRFPKLLSNVHHEQWRTRGSSSNSPRPPPLWRIHPSLCSRGAHGRPQQARWKSGAARENFGPPYANRVPQSPNFLHSRWPLLFVACAVLQQRPFVLAPDRLSPCWIPQPAP